MIFWIAVTLFVIVNGQDVSFQYDGCYSNGITMTAKYTGSGTVTAVQWYYSGKKGNNLLVAAASCSVFGSIPPGYPSNSQMQFQCPSTNSALNPNTFKLTVTGLEWEDLRNSWGATFSLSTSSSPAVVEDSFSLCAFGENAIVSFENECYNVGDTLKLTAKYTGSGDPSLVQWYFSGVPAEKFILQTSNCDIFGSIPVGFPDANRLDYSCSLSENTYKLEVTDLQAAEVNASWGATFNPPIGAVPAPIQEPVVECKSAQGPSIFG